jgi:hypothetical protein
MISIVPIMIVLIAAAPGTIDGGRYAHCWEPLSKLPVISAS